MTIEVKVIADSISPEGKRITTIQARYPRIIHAEVMTHRMISKSASGSRAIPVKQMINDILKDPFVPEYWGLNEKGMQAKREAGKLKRFFGRFMWLLGLRLTVYCVVKPLLLLGFHKQIVNRLLEPWGHIHVVMTATEWDNFFSLRCHPDAEPHIQKLARAILDAMNNSTPKSLGYGQWHLPYVLDSERGLPIDEQLKISVARCARVSYAKHGSTTVDVQNDIELYDRLVCRVPLHATPLEHQAMAPVLSGKTSGNFVGWFQFRKTFNAENIDCYGGLITKKYERQ